MKMFLNGLGLAAFATLGFLLGRWQPQPANVSLPSIAVTTTTPTPLSQTLGLSEAEARQIVPEAVDFKDVAVTLRKLGPYAPLDVLKAFFRRWASVEPSAACAFFKTFGMPDAKGADVGVVLMEEWSKLDAAAAAQYALAEIDGGETAFGTRTLIKALAAHDPEAAFKLCLKRIVPMDAIFAEWAKRDFNAAAAALTQIPPGSRQEEAAYVLLDQAMASDPSNALTWFRSLPDSVRAEIGLNKMLSRYDKAPPAVYFTMLGEQLLSFGHNDDVSTALRAVHKSATDEEALTKLNDGVTGRIGNRMSDWATKDPQGALTWARQFPDTTLRPVLIGQSARALLQQGRTAEAETLLQELPPCLHEGIRKAAAEHQ